MTSPRVYVVSDVRLYREGLTGSLATHGGLAIVGAAAAADAMAQIAALQPDVMLLDLAARDSLSLPRAALASVPSLRVVAFAVTEVAAEVLACAEAGICGYVTKDGSVEDVVAAVLRATTGKLACSPEIAALLFRRVASLSVRQSRAPAMLVLTARELEIAELVSCGLPNKEIARELHLCPATIKNHVHNILQKLHLQRRGEIGGLLRRVNSAFRPAMPANEAPRPSF